MGRVPDAQVLLVAPLFPFLFPTPLRLRYAGSAVTEGSARRREADVLRRHDIAVENVQQLPAPSLRPHVAYLHDVDVDPHLPPDKRGMLGGEQLVDVDGLGWIDRLLWSSDPALQHIQQQLEPPLASHLPHQRGIGLHPLGLAQGWLVLLGQLWGNGDGVERIDDDPLQVVFREARHAFLLPFENAVQLYYLLYRYSLATIAKGKWGACPALCGNDSRPSPALAHEFSRDPHEKRRKLLTSDDVPTSPLTLLPFSRYGGRRGMLVSIPRKSLRSERSP